MELSKDELKNLPPEPPESDEPTVEVEYGNV